MSPLSFTSAQFVRAHSKEPKGRGQWLFQASSSRAAFHFTGEVRCFGGLNATLTEAKAAAKREGVTGLWAILS